MENGKKEILKTEHNKEKKGTDEESINFANVTSRLDKPFTSWEDNVTSTLKIDEKVSKVFAKFASSSTHIDKIFERKLFADGVSVDDHRPAVVQ
uniref:Uncharacterized protein n=1 Tax=Romanomermis culicivorax TaxID=13658 RepID=A0A915JV12_ROMCU